MRRRIRALLEAGLDSSVETAVWGAAAMSHTEVAKAVDGLSAQLKAIFHAILHVEPSLRLSTAAELEEALRGRLAELRPYSAEAALAEVEQIMSDAGASLVEQTAAGGVKNLLRSPEDVATR